MAYKENSLTTLSHKLYVARGLATFDTAIDLTAEGDYAQRPDDVLDLFKADIVTPKNTLHFPESDANGLCFYFMGSAAADKNMAWRLVAWRNENGPAEIVAYGTATTGTQAVVKYPHNGATATNVFWCDTIVITAEYWPKEIEATAAGGNSISKLFLDSCGYRYWKAEITATGADDVTNAAVYYGYF